MDVLLDADIEALIFSPWSSFLVFFIDIIYCSDALTVATESFPKSTSSSSKSI